MMLDDRLRRARDDYQALDPPPPKRGSPPRIWPRRPQALDARSWSRSPPSQRASCWSRR